MARVPKKTTRNKSVRGYRRQMDVVLAQARRGELPWTEARAAVAALKEAASTLLAENLMRAQGVDDQEAENHPLGPDGGLEDYAPHKKARRPKRVTTVVKTVVSPKGTHDEESEKITK